MPYSSTKGLIVDTSVDSKEKLYKYKKNDICKKIYG